MWHRFESHYRYNTCASKTQFTLSILLCTHSYLALISPLPPTNFCCWLFLNTCHWLPFYKRSKFRVETLPPKTSTKFLELLYRTFFQRKNWHPSSSSLKLLYRTFFQRKNWHPSSSYLRLLYRTFFQRKNWHPSPPPPWSCLKWQHVKNGGTLGIYFIQSLSINLNVFQFQIYGLYIWGLTIIIIILGKAISNKEMRFRKLNFLTYYKVTMDEKITMWPLFIKRDCKFC